MKKFFIISNSKKKSGIQLAYYVRDYLESRGCRVSVATEVDTELAAKTGKYRYTDPESVLPDTECIIVLGGDGTMLQAAGDLKELHIPILGINNGTLGYLANVDPDSVTHALNCLISGNFTIEEHMMLRGQIFAKRREGEVLEEDGGYHEFLIPGRADFALNDLVLSRSRGLDVNDYNIYVDGEYLNRYVADGMIIATPTGSTAYNLSAGGPIVDPTARCILLTPISPHSLANRSIVLSADSTIAVEITKRFDKDFTPVQVGCDGNYMGTLYEGDRIEIWTAPQTVSIVKVRNISFLETLRKKMADR